MKDNKIKGEEISDYTDFDKCAEFITKRIGSYVSTERNKKELSIRKFANKINVSSTVLSDLENGTKIPRMGTILKVLWALNIPFEKVFAKDVLPDKEFKNISDPMIKIEKGLLEQNYNLQDIKDIMDYIKFKKDKWDKK